MTYPLARTPEEALRYLELHPCEVCGSVDFGLDSVLFSDGGQTVRRYAGRCAGCGTEREFLFRVPAEPVPPAPPGYARFGGPEPSELLDPGQWLALADSYGQGYPADLAQLAPADVPRARRRLAYALAALDEAAKFIPAGADAVPESALWTDSGRALWQREPYRFRLPVIDAYRDTYRDLLTTLIRADPPAEAPPPPPATVTPTNGTPTNGTPTSGAGTDGAGSTGRVPVAPVVTDAETGLRRLSGEEMRHVARLLARAEPLLRLAEPRWAAEQFGWRPAPEQPYGGALAVDAGFGLPGPANAELGLDLGHRGVQAATVWLCERVAAPSTAGDRFCQDVFAIASRELSAEFGRPTSSEPGARPRISWRLGEVTLTLMLTMVTVMLTAKRNADLDALAAQVGDEG